MEKERRSWVSVAFLFAFLDGERKTRIVIATAYEANLYELDIPMSFVIF